jgi:hypothetical protein
LIDISYLIYYKEKDPFISYLKEYCTKFNYFITIIGLYIFYKCFYTVFRIYKERSLLCYIV